MGAAVTPERARESLAAFEAGCGYRLTSMPPMVRDHWDQKLVAMFADLEADLDDRTQANAAFAGAFTVLTTLLTNAMIPAGQLQIAVSILRGLADRADATSMVDEFETWLKNQ